MISPFEREHADAWATEIIDVPSLNQSASKAIIDSVEAIRKSAQASEVLPRSSTLVLGPAGAGKTHLIARCRRQLGPRAAFVVLRPEIGVDPTPRAVLAATIDSLTRASFGTDESQLEIVVASALAALRGQHTRYPTVQLEELRSLSADERETIFESALDALEDADRSFGAVAGWAEKLFRVPFAGRADRRALLGWLSGRQLDEGQLERIKLKSALEDSAVMPALSLLARLAAMGAPLVLVFDQLENLVDEHAGPGRVHAHANLVAELFDTVRGVVLVQMALDAEWEQRIAPALSDSQRTRVANRVQTLALPTQEQRVDLVRAWIEKLPDASTLGSFPAPFTPTQIARWKSTLGLTPRQLMIACRVALEHGEDLSSLPVTSSGTAVTMAPPSIVSNDEHLKSYWGTIVREHRSSLDARVQASEPLDATRIASVLNAAVPLVFDDAVIEKPTSAQKHDVTVRRGKTEVHVTIFQHVNGTSASAAARHAVGALKSGHRIVLIRQKEFPVPDSWRTVRMQLDDLRKAGAMIVEPSVAELAEGLALHAVVASARSQDVTDASGIPLGEDVVRAWLASHVQPRSWALISALFGGTSPPGSATGGGHSSGGGSAGNQSLKTAIRTAAPAAPAAPAMASLESLGVASISRVLEHVRGRGLELHQGDLYEQLREEGARVRWFGRNVVAFAGDVR